MSDDAINITNVSDEAIENRAALECVELIKAGKATLVRGPGGMVMVKFPTPTSIARQPPQSGVAFFEGHPAFDGIQS